MTIELERIAHLCHTGVQVVALLALSDQGVPVFQQNVAQEVAGLGATAFACTPGLFPELIAATLNCKDLRLWAAQHTGILIP